MLWPTPPTVHWLLVFFSFTENLRSPHFVATCGPASKPNCRRCGPKTPRRSCSTCSCRLSHSFWRLSKLLRQIFNNLQASLQDTNNNRLHTIAQAGGKRTVIHTHTHAAAPGCSHIDENSPKRAQQNNPGGYNVNPNAATNLFHFWTGTNLMITPRSSPISSLVP